jgi:hypothetical protein
LPPARILDTRSAGGAIGAGKTRSVRVTGVGGVPSSGVTDVALDVVALDPTAAGSLTVAPHGGPRPADPQLTWSMAQRVNSLVWVKVGPGGLVDVTNRTGTTQLFVDVQGYYTQATGAGDVLTTVAPGTLLDTRSRGPIAGGATRSFAAVGNGVPSGATAALVQVTAARPSKRDYVRIWGTGNRKPGSYALYAPAGAYTSATAVVPLTAAGGLAVSPTYATNVVVTLLGWYATSSQPTSGVTSLVTPTHRVMRVTLGPHKTTTVRLALPASAGAALLDVTGTGTPSGAVFVWATGQPLPRTALVHLAAAPATTSVAVVIGSGGRVALRNWTAKPAVLVVDAVGWVSR